MGPPPGGRSSARLSTKREKKLRIIGFTSNILIKALVNSPSRSRKLQLSRRKFTAAQLLDSLRLCHSCMSKARATLRQKTTASGLQKPVCVIEERVLPVRQEIDVGVQSTTKTLILHMVSQFVEWPCHCLKPPIV